VVSLRGGNTFFLSQNLGVEVHRHSVSEAMKHKLSSLLECRREFLHDLPPGGIRGHVLVLL